MGRYVLVAALLPIASVLGGCDPEVEGPDDEGEALGEDDDVEDEEDAEPGEHDPGEDEPGDDAPGDDAEDEEEPEPRPEAVVPCDPAVPYGGYACTMEDGSEGSNYCLLLEGEEFWTECSAEAPDCEPGEGFDQGCLGDLCYWDGDALRYYSWQEPNCNTPLVLSFDDGPIEFAPATAASFDLSSDGTCESTDWPSAPWLALDRDGDGFIRDGGELFGDATRMSAGGYADHGFAALAELDSNRDGKISAADDRFGELVMWSDLDGDRIGAYAELHPIAESSLVSIDLAFDRERACDAAGNCAFERAAFEYRTPEGRIGVGEVVDVHLVCR